jgi:AcrR family transcriptional regulator
MPGSKELAPKKFLILDSALKILSENGLQSLGVTRLSQETKLSKSLILYHYADNQQILEDLFFFSHKMVRYFMEKNIPRDGVFERKIIGMVRALFEWVSYNKDVGEFFVLLFHQGLKSKEIEASFRELLQSMQDQWERIFLESMRYKSLEEIKIITTGVSRMVVGTLVMMISTGDSENCQEHLQSLRFNLETLLSVELPLVEI